MFDEFVERVLLSSEQQNDRKQRRPRSPIVYAPPRVAGAAPPVAVVTFGFKGDGDLRLLCNCPGGEGHEIVLDGVRFLTEEHALQYHKFVSAASTCLGTSRERDLRRYAEMFAGTRCPLRSVDQARAVGKAVRLSREEINSFYESSIGLQTKICMYKFTQNARLRKALRATGDAVLVNSCGRRDGGLLWSGYVDRNGQVQGKNHLGRIWMRIRNSMR